MGSIRAAMGWALAGMMALPGSPALAGDDKAAIDGIVTPFIKNKAYLGLVVGIARRGEEHVFAYGKVALEGKSVAPDARTIFEIGSMTKVFTGTLLADQVKRGTMRLDDPAQRYLPADVKLPRRDDRDITLLHLATHTSSLPVEPPYIGLLALSSKDPANPYGEYGQKQLIKTLKHLELGHPIGSRYAYSNLGVGLLGQALARTAKASSYQDLMVKQIAMPLGLPDTRLTLDAGQTKRLAPGHTALGARTSPWTFACLEACGGMRSTVRDMLIFTKANLGEIKTPLASAFQMAQEPWRETGHKGGFVGLCWQRWKLPPGESVVLWHNGGTGGYRSFMGLIPKKGAGVVVLSNSAHFVDAMGMEILKHLDKD